VYEPMIALRDGRALETSRVLDPQAGRAPAEVYHRDCFKDLHGDRALPA